MKLEPQVTEKVKELISRQALTSNERTIVFCWLEDIDQIAADLSSKSGISTSHMSTYLKTLEVKKIFKKDIKTRTYMLHPSLLKKLVPQEPRVKKEKKLVVQPIVVPEPIKPTVSLDSIFFSWKDTVPAKVSSSERKLLLQDLFFNIKTNGFTQDDLSTSFKKMVLKEAKLYPPNKPQYNQWKQDVEDDYDSAVKSGFAEKIEIISKDIEENKPVVRFNPFDTENEFGSKGIYGQGDDAAVDAHLNQFPTSTFITIKYDDLDIDVPFVHDRKSARSTGYYRVTPIFELKINELGLDENKIKRLLYDKIRTLNN